MFKIIAGRQVWIPIIEEWTLDAYNATFFDREAMAREYVRVDRQEFRCGEAHRRFDCHHLAQQDEMPDPLVLAVNADGLFSTFGAARSAVLPAVVVGPHFRSEYDTEGQLVVPPQAAHEAAA